MRCKKNLLLVGLIFLCTNALLFLLIEKIYAQVNSLGSVNATVQISVCGNNVVEVGEDCEGVNLNGQTCTGLWYERGNLTCDIACSFDTNSCIGMPVTPTPSPTPSPTVIPIPTLISIPTATPIPTPTASFTSTTTTQATTISETTSTPTSAPVIEIVAPAIVQEILPSVIELFDIDESGRIEPEEVFTAIKYWVEDWKGFLHVDNLSDGNVGENLKNNKCDINKDKQCNLKDLSILLYYVGR